MRNLFIIFVFFSSFAFSQSTIDSLQTSLNKNPESSTHRVDLLNQLGYEYWIINANKSIIFGVQALNLANNLSYKQGMAKANRVIGVAHWAQGTHNKALEYLIQAENLYRELNNEEGLANSIMNIGMVYADLQLYDKAHENYTNAINKFTALDLKGRIATTYTKLGTLYLENGKLNDAKTFLNSALKMHSEAGFTYGIAEAHNHLGALYIKENEFEQAYYHLHRSILLGKQINDVDGGISNLILLGKLLRYDNKPEESRENLILALKRAKQHKLTKYELQVYEELKELERKDNNLTEAIEFYDKYNNLKDSILNTEKSMQIAAIEFNHELDKKNNELDYLTQKEKTDLIIRWILIAASILIASLGLLLVLNFKKREQKSTALLSKNKELMISKEELANTALENAHLKQLELKQQLDFKNKELTSYALNFVQKNELLLLLQEKIKTAKGAVVQDQTKLMAEIGRILKQHLSIDKDWEDFKLHFEQVHTGFYAKIKKDHPGISANDLKICTLIRLNLNIKETAGILGISPESVKTARYRLRKKLSLKPEQELLDYFLSLEKG